MAKVLFSVVAIFATFIPGASFGELASGDSKPFRPLASNSDLVQPPVKIRPPMAPTMYECPRGFVCIMLDSLKNQQKPVVPSREPLNAPRPQKGK